MKTPSNNLDNKPGNSSEFDRFRDALKAVVSVPKDDFDRELQRQQAEKPPEPRGRKKKAA
jgi:hypothetical protein